jgi:drug/metabolite transporter (DMT)-like permease
MVDRNLQRFAFLALLAAALFGASAPLSKLLLIGIQPLSLAGLLYLGSGLGLLLIWIVRHGRGKGDKEAPLMRHDLPWLAGAVITGGIAAPVLLLWGLSGVLASGASLLLSTEGVLTTLIAALAFREAVDVRVWIASTLMIAAGALLAYEPGASFGLSLHALAVVAACALWGLDNNLTRPISGGDPVVIAMVKGITAGSVNLVLGAFMGETWPALDYVGGALLLGSLSYGASLLCYILALRHLGSARTAAHFGTAPFIGAILSVILLGEPLTATVTGAFALMVAATWLVLTEQHGHAHVHEPMTHTHAHSHDAHHQHAHNGSEGPEPHTHKHQHDPLTHTHAHLPDLHHRHEH